MCQNVFISGAQGKVPVVVFSSLTKWWPEHPRLRDKRRGVVARIIYSVAALSPLKFVSDFLPTGLGAVVSCFPGF